MVVFKNEVYVDKLFFYTVYDRGEILIKYSIQDDKKPLFKRYGTLEAIFKFVDGLDIKFQGGIKEVSYKDGVLYIPKNDVPFVNELYLGSNIPEDVFNKLIEPFKKGFIIKLTPGFNNMDLDFDKHDYYVGTEIELDVEEQYVHDKKYLIDIVNKIDEEYHIEMATEWFNNSGFEVRTPPTPREECFEKYGSLVQFMVDNGMIVGIDNDIHYHIDMRYLGKTNGEKKSAIMKIVNTLIRFEDKIVPLRRFKTERLRNDCPYASEVAEIMGTMNPTFDQMWEGCKTWAGCVIPIDRHWNGEGFTNTLEFRLFVTPTDEVEYIGQLDFIHQLLQVKNFTDKELEEITWEELFENKTTHLDEFLRRNLDEE